MRSGAAFGCCGIRTIIRLQYATAISPNAPALGPTSTGDFDPLNAIFLSSHNNEIETPEKERGELQLYVGLAEFSFSELT